MTWNSVFLIVRSIVILLRKIAVIENHILWLIHRHSWHVTPWCRGYSNHGHAGGSCKVTMCLKISLDCITTDLSAFWPRTVLMGFSDSAQGLSVTIAYKNKRGWKFTLLFLSCCISLRFTELEKWNVSFQNYWQHCNSHKRQFWSINRHILMTAIEP